MLSGLQVVHILRGVYDASPTFPFLGKATLMRVFQRVFCAFIAQLVERSLGKTEVLGSIPNEGSTNCTDLNQISKRVE